MMFLMLLEVIAGVCTALRAGQRCGDANQAVKVVRRAMALHGRSGQFSGCEAWMRFAEMTRHTIAIGILQPLSMRVCESDSAQMQSLISQSFSSVIWVETSHFWPPLP